MTSGSGYESCLKRSLMRWSVVRFQLPTVNIGKVSCTRIQQSSSQLQVQKCVSVYSSLCLCINGKMLTCVVKALGGVVKTGKALNKCSTFTFG